MDTTTTLKEAIAALQTELPTLIGDGWPEFEAQLDRLLQQLDAEPASAGVTRAMIMALFGEHPAAHERLVAAMAEMRMTADRSGTRGGQKGAQKGVQPDKVIRYTDISCPRRVWVQTPRFSVILRLTVQRPEYSTAVEELELDPDQPVRVLLQAPGFTVLNEPVQLIEIRPEADSPPVVFDLKPNQVGHASLTFDFFQGSEPVGTATVPLEVTAYEVAEDAAPGPVQAVRMDPHTSPPDMVLHIATQESPPALEFTLIRDGGAWMRTFPPMALNAEAKAQATELYRTIASLVASADPTVEAVLGEYLCIAAADVDRRVRTLGQNLWRNLIPSELKALYADEREAWRDRTLLVFSDEPHLPWELVWPYERGGWTDEGPWCQTLFMTRWLRKDSQGNGNETPPARMRLRAMAVLAPLYSLLSDLTGAQMEQDVMAGMIVQHALDNVSPAEPTWQAVMDLLEGGTYDWLHAAAHGNFYGMSPDSDSALWLQQDQALTPDAIVGPEIEGHLHDARPAFFFNACQTGRQGWALTRIGGWANRLVSGGASLFVGPLWEVSDGGALRFAQAFYAGLFDGGTVAEATRRGREAARAAGDPTWAAYSVYAHPNARLEGGGQ